MKVLIGDIMKSLYWLQNFGYDVKLEKELESDKEWPLLSVIRIKSCLTRGRTERLVDIHEYLANTYLVIDEGKADVISMDSDKYNVKFITDIGMEEIAHSRVLLTYSEFVRWAK